MPPTNSTNPESRAPEAVTVHLVRPPHQWRFSCDREGLARMTATLSTLSAGAGSLDPLDAALVLSHLGHHLVGMQASGDGPAGCETDVDGASSKAPSDSTVGAPTWGTPSAKGVGKGPCLPPGPQETLP